jgi:RNA polymerase sigma-70 factor (ECF subfamily)
MDASMLVQASANPENLMENLVARAKCGDKEAFGLIFEHHHRFVFKFVYAMLGNYSAAEEMTQETFLGAYRSLSSLKNDAALKTWLCSIAKNNVYKSFRANRKEGKQSNEEIETLDLVDDKTPSPDDRLVNRELNQSIAAALAGLDEDKRAVFVLKEIQQLSYQEISEITGDAVPKLKTDLFRAKARMRKVLQPYLEVER